jgi:hypothetical protein
VHQLRRLYSAAILVGSGWFLVAHAANGGSGASLVVAVVAGIMLCATPAWRILRHACTFVHEMGHAVAAVGLGGRVQRITYQPDASGLATFSLPTSFGRVRSIIATGAGYAGPPIAGLVAVQAGAAQLGGVWLLTAAGASGLAFLLFVRNLWGGLYTVVLGAGMLALYFRLAWGLDEVAGVWAGVLLGGGVRGALIQCRTTEFSGSDAWAIGKLTFLPGRLVAWAQFGLAVGAVGVGLYLAALG